MKGTNNNGRSILNILIGGEAGQGLVTVSQILSKSLVRSGYCIVVTQSYQSRIRVGHNSFAIRVGTEEIVAPQESVDLLVALDKNTVDLHRAELSSNYLVVIDEAFGIDGDSILRVPFKGLAQERFSNIAALGVVSTLLGLNKGLVIKTVEDFFGKAHLDALKENRAVFERSSGWTSERSVNFDTLVQVPEPPGRLMMNGNEAIALGALSSEIGRAHV